MVNLFSQARWVEIQSAEIEVNSVGRPLFVSGSTDTNSASVDATADACDRSVAGLWNDRNNDSPQVHSDSFGS